jgi:RNA polymerase sigma-70 factor (ECF subfamily)
MTDFHRLYERYAPVVRHFALFLSGNAFAADDITSETFLRVWTARGGIRESTVKAYLFTIARYVYRDTLRSKHGRCTELDEQVPDTHASTEAQVEHRLELESVLASLRSLPELDRTAVLMRAAEDMSYEEIASALDLPLSTVKVKIHRARLKLLKAEMRAHASK